MKKSIKFYIGIAVIFCVLLFSGVTVSADKKEKPAGIPKDTVFTENRYSKLLDGDNIRYSSGKPELTEIGKQRMLQAGQKAKSEATISKQQIPVSVDNSKLKLEIKDDLGHVRSFPIYTIFTLICMQ